MIVTKIVRLAILAFSIPASSVCVATNRLFGSKLPNPRKPTFVVCCAPCGRYDLPTQKKDKGRDCSRPSHGVSLPVFSPLVLTVLRRSAASSIPRKPPRPPRSRSMSESRGAVAGPTQHGVPRKVGRLCGERRSDAASERPALAGCET